jgi:predicted HTH transcriptional regulator
VVEVARAGRTSIALPAGLPTEAWLWLKNEDEWLDFRSLGYWGGHRSSDVEEDLPRDLAADLSGLASQGEGLYLEYKEKIPDTPGEKRNVFKTVAAFANGGGGIVLFGISDAGEIRGVPGDSAEQVRRLNDMVRDLVTPAPSVHIDAQRFDKLNVIIMNVEPGNGVLHSLTLDKNRPEYYIRREATTFYARPEEIAAIINRNNNATSQPSWY